MGSARVHPLPSQLRPASRHDVSNGLDDVSTTKKAAKKLKQVYDESKLLREFLLYLAFVAVFSFVSFCSKPGITQYHLTTEAKSVWGPTNVNQVPDIWTWLENTFLSTTYPQVDYNGALLDRTSRLYVLGQVRAGQLPNDHSGKSVNLSHMPKPETCPLSISRIFTLLMTLPSLVISISSNQLQARRTSSPLCVLWRCAPAVKVSRTCSVTKCLSSKPGALRARAAFKRTTETSRYQNHSDRL